MHFLKVIIPAMFGLVIAFVISCAPPAQSNPRPPEKVRKLTCAVPPVTQNFSFATPPKHERNERQNNRQNLTKPYVIFVSIDGYRHDYTEKYSPPTLSEIARNGVQAKSLRPSFPSNTFPNHYSLVTGMVPAHHGIISNFFYDKARKAEYAMTDGKAVRDGSWYRGLPLWRAVSEAGMLSGTVYWVGSEAKIAGGLPDYYMPWSPQMDNYQRVDKVIEWMSEPEETRPHFVALYFSAVDSAGHKNGPESSDVCSSVMEIDNALAKLRSFAQQNDINLVIVSDHGMALKGEHIALNDKQNGVDLSGFTAKESGAITMLYSNDQKLINKTVQEINSRKNWSGKLKAYRRADVPASLNFNDDVDRIGDIVVIAKMPYIIQVKREEPANILAAPSGNIATHGWTLDNSDMHGIFYAEGPDFKQGLEIPSFQNVHIYPMILKLLGIKVTGKIDGSVKQLEDILR